MFNICTGVAGIELAPHTFAYEYVYIGLARKPLKRLLGTLLRSSFYRRKKYDNVTTFFPPFNAMGIVKKWRVYAKKNG